MSDFNKKSQPPTPETLNSGDISAVEGIKLDPVEMQAIQIYCRSFLAGWDIPFNRVSACLALVFLPERIRELLWPDYVKSPERMARINQAIAKLRELIGISEQPEAKKKIFFICAAWKTLADGCVARCDKEEKHADDHLDSVIDVSWPRP